MGYRNARDIGDKGPVFAITNWTSDVAMDCNSAADAEICDVLGTLIKELIERGIINGSVSA